MRVDTTWRTCAGHTDNVDCSVGGVGAADSRCTGSIQRNGLVCSAVDVISHRSIWRSGESKRSSAVGTDGSRTHRYTRRW